MHGTSSSAARMRSIMLKPPSAPTARPASKATGPPPVSTPIDRCLRSRRKDAPSPSASIAESSGRRNKYTSSASARAKPRQKRRSPRTVSPRRRVRSRGVLACLTLSDACRSLPANRKIGPPNAAFPFGLKESEDVAPSSDDSSSAVQAAQRSPRPLFIFFALRAWRS